MTAINTASNAMIVLTRIRRDLDQSTALEDIHNLRDQAEIIRQCIKTAAFGLDLQNEAAEMKLCCERQIGQILTQFSLQGGDRKSKNREHRVTLEELGISNCQSSRWQREGSVPEEDFLRFVKQTNEERRELTSRGLLHLARILADAAKPAYDDKDPLVQISGGLKDLARRQKRFACIYADPPWNPDKKTKLVQLRKSLCSLPVKLVAAPQAHLHLWVSPESLESGLAVLRAWGFHYKALLVRSKSPLQYGCYWPPKHDLLLLGVRGALLFRDTSLPSLLNGHDDSPANSLRETCSLIARVSLPPYLDLFGNAASTGWATPVPS